MKIITAYLCLLTSSLAISNEFMKIENDNMQCVAEEIIFISRKNTQRDLRSLENNHSISAAEYQKISSFLKKKKSEYYENTQAPLTAEVAGGCATLAALVSASLIYQNDADRPAHVIEQMAPLGFRMFVYATLAGVVCGIGAHGILNRETLYKFKIETRDDGSRRILLLAN